MSGRTLKVGFDLIEMLSSCAWLAGKKAVVEQKTRAPQMAVGSKTGKRHLRNKVRRESLEQELQKMA